MIVSIANENYLPIIYGKEDLLKICNKQTKYLYNRVEFIFQQLSSSETDAGKIVQSIIDENEIYALRNFSSSRYNVECII